MSSHGAYEMVLPLALVAAVLTLPATAVAADDPQPNGLARRVAVSWDFRGDTATTSPLYVGARVVGSLYDRAECLSRFTLEEARFSLHDVEVNGKPAPKGPAFLTLKFRKHFPGDFDFLPRVTIVQNQTNRVGKPTGQMQKVTFPFREKKMAKPATDWSAADIDVEIAAPGETMTLHNPMDWFGIEVDCE